MSSWRRRGMSTMDVDLGVVGNQAVVRFTGEIDMAVADDMASVATVALDREGLKSLVIDLTEVTFMDSCGLRALVEAHDAAQSKGISWQLQGLSPQLKRLLSVTGLSEYLAVPTTDTRPS
jgi:anti-anti-sigma factor